MDKKADKSFKPTPRDESFVRTLLTLLTEVVPLVKNKDMDGVEAVSS